MLNKTVLVAAITLVVAGCEPIPQPSPVSPEATTVPTTASSPTLSPTSKPTVKPTAVKQSRPAATPTPKAIVSTPRTTSSPAVTRSLVTSLSAIPAQSGSCQELRAKGISNIDVNANLWAKRLDRDKDGIACESN